MELEESDIDEEDIIFDYVFNWFNGFEVDKK